VRHSEYPVSKLGSLCGIKNGSLRSLVISLSNGW
jgi:hypothetical protein